MLEYVVYLVTYSGDKLPKYYIGSTSKIKIDKGYLGSIRSKKWYNIFNFEVKNNRDLFTITILSYHETRKDALDEELKIQRERDVVKSSDYFNESFACVRGFFGMKLSDEQKREISKRTSELHRRGVCHKLPPLFGKDNPMFGKTNEVVAINVLTNEKVRVSKEEFDNNINLSGHTVGLVSVIDIKTGENVNIPKEVYRNNKDLYKHKNTGFKHTDELKSKLSNMRIGYVTSKDWDGNFYRIHKDDERLKTGEFGTISSKRWIVTDTDNNEYRVFNIRKFFRENGLRLPMTENLDENGLISFKKKPNVTSSVKSTDGWKIKCLGK